MYRVALVEDQQRIAELIRHALSRAGIETDRFRNQSEAAFGVARADYTVLIVDRGLPDGDGLDLVRKLRTAGNMTPCLMLTARDALHDRVDGLESGADDYLTKPFAMDELVARVRSLIRRPAVVMTLTPAIGDLVVDPEHFRLRRGDETVSLAPAELQIMLCLVAAAGRTVRHGSLEHAAWGLGEAVTPNALDVALHRLRKKLAAIESGVRIMNMRGQGYALEMRSKDDTLRPDLAT